MKTPINTKNLKTPISTIKKGPVKGLKNVLAHPQEFTWTIVKDESSETIKNMLIDLLPDDRDKAKPVPWSQLRKMTKDERATLKKENQAKRMENKENSIKNQMCFGVNEVTKGLEGNSLASVLVDSNIEPLLMVKHIVMMGQNKNVPVILVPFVKSSTGEKMGFASAALGIKKSAVEDKNSKFNKIHEAICALADDFPKKKNPTQLFSEKDEEDEEEIDDEEEKVEEKAAAPPSKPEPFRLSTSVYLERASTKERAFVPSNSQEKPKEESWSEFISLGDDMDMTEFEKNAEEVRKRGRYMEINEPEEKNENNEKIQEKKKRRKNQYEPMESGYCSLKVKRVQGNPHRLKATKAPKAKKKGVEKK